MTLITPANNPAFTQYDTLWKIHYRVPMEFVLALEDALQDIALATSSFEDPKDESFWTVEILTASVPEQGKLQKALQHVAENCGIALPMPEIEEISTEDWQQSLQHSFPPISVGRFFVHGQHAKDLMPAGAYPIEVEAGMAFGSGEHATTSSCLRAIHNMHKAGYQPESILDMGTGSGILAIAAARCWPQARIVGVDIDPVSVRIANQNFRLNRLNPQIRAYAADGYDIRAVQQDAPYDMIFSNILARPLVAFSHALASHLSYGGRAVLSGLLATQERRVLNAHRRQGLALDYRILSHGWSTLVMKN